MEQFKSLSRASSEIPCRTLSPKGFSSFLFRFSKHLILSCALQRHKKTDIFQCRFSGADGRDRTDNLFITNELLCHGATSAFDLQRKQLYSKVKQKSSPFSPFLKYPLRWISLFFSLVRCVVLCYTFCEYDSCRKEAYHGIYAAAWCMEQCFCRARCIDRSIHKNSRR